MMSCHTFLYLLIIIFFFFNDTATTEIYTLSLHDALPICVYGTLDFVGYPRFPAPVEFIAAVIAYYVHPVNIKLNRSRKARVSYKIGRAVQQECRDRSRMPSSA